MERNQLSLNQVAKDVGYLASLLGKATVVAGSYLGGGISATADTVKEYSAENTESFTHELETKSVKRLASEYHTRGYANTAELFNTGKSVVKDPFSKKEKEEPVSE